ncbi:hypothetical protein G6F35_003163 [Rhizopus arrhizus]|nr:hypothetical protein G6F35_003163 [Rhizopus arrhizus]
MAEEEVDIYGDYEFGLGDDLEEIVHDVPAKKRSRSDTEETSDEKHVKSLRLNEDQNKASQKIQTTTQAYQNNRQQQQQQQQQQQIPTSLTQLRGISNQPTSSIYLGELHWSKGIVFLEFDNEEYASHAKDIFERTEFDNKRVYALFTTSSNPFRHLPKESNNKSTRNIVNNTANIPRMGNTTMNFAFNPSMPYFPTPAMPPNIRMYNEMMMRGNMRNNGRGGGRNGTSFNNPQAGTGNSMYINPAFFEQQQ